jgi:hypothetical protein
MTQQLKVRSKAISVSKTPTFATYQDRKLLLDLRKQIRNEAVKNTARMEQARLQNTLNQLSPAVREAAVQRVSTLKKFLQQA